MSSIAKVLVVDDNPKYLNDVLPLYGYDVIVACDGLEALKLLSKKNLDIDLILLDIIMPKMSGWDVLKHIRENEVYKEIPIIMLTALDSDQKQISGLKFGADDYIVKPFALPNLLARLEALLRRSRWQEKKEQNSSMNISETLVVNLTTREKDVLKMAAEGANNNNIAIKLNIKEVTVKTHLNSIFKKLNATNRTQAVLLAMKKNLLNQ